MIPKNINREKTFKNIQKEQDTEGVMTQTKKKQKGFRQHIV